MLAGTGELKDKIKAKVKASGLESCVEFLGDCDNVYEVLQQSDVMCLPSFSEGLGIVFIEAQACGVKCVASDKVPMEAKVSDDIIFVSLEKNAEYWADRILELDVSVKNDNHESIEKRGYNINEVAARLEKFYIEQYENSDCGEK